MELTVRDPPTFIRGSRLERELYGWHLLSYTWLLGSAKGSRLVVGRVTISGTPEASSVHTNFHDQLYTSQ